MEDLVMRSDRDWTIVRPARLVDTPTITPYRVQEGYMVPGLGERWHSGDTTVEWNRGPVTQAGFLVQSVSLSVMALAKPKSMILGIHDSPLDYSSSQEAPNVSPWHRSCAWSAQFS
jgi:hypothetical protein